MEASISTTPLATADYMYLTLNFEASRDGLLRLGDDGDPSHCLTRSIHTLDQLRRPQYQALGAVHALEGSRTRRDSAQKLTRGGSLEE